jgi:hypothetical protein
MSNSKISALTSATTPLAGTEVLPVNQSGTTTQVSVSNLTAGRTVALRNANLTGGSAAINIGASGDTTYHYTRYIDNNNNSLYVGIDNSAGSFFGAGAYGRVLYSEASVPLSVFVNAAKTFTFDTSSNLVPATAAKGINFTANTPASGMTSQNLTWYEEGTFTPTLILGAGSVTYTSQSARYTRIGRVVIFSASIVVNTATTPSGTMEIGGLPFTPASNAIGAVAIEVSGATALATTTWMGNVESAAKFVRIYTYASGNLANPGAYVQAGFSIQISATYEV